MIKKILFSLCMATLIPASAYARTVGSCASFTDPIKIGILQNELKSTDMPFTVDGNLICVSSEYKDDFYNLVSKTFPPDPNKAKAITIPTSPSGLPLNSVKLSDIEQQRLLIAEFQKRDIWYTESEDGFIWYELSNEKEVSEFVFKIVEEDIPAGRSIGYPKEAYAKIFTSLLSENGISFKRKYRNKTYYIVWDANDSNKVEPLKEKARGMIIDYLKNKKAIK